MDLFGLKAGLDCNEEVHRARILGEWSNMIGYIMGFSSFVVYARAWNSPVVNGKHGWKNDMVANMATFFCSGSSMRSSFLGNLKPLDKKLDLHKPIAIHNNSLYSTFREVLLKLQIPGSL
jgi:hypothetical protein